jgi:hypothetical protein
LLDGTKWLCTGEDDIEEVDDDNDEEEEEEEGDAGTAGTGEYVAEEGNAFIGGDDCELPCPSTCASFENKSVAVEMGGGMGMELLKRR